MIDIDASIRDAIDERVQKARPYWIGGIPTAAEMNAIQIRVARDLGVSLVDVQRAADGRTSETFA